MADAWPIGVKSPGNIRWAFPHCLSLKSIWNQAEGAENWQGPCKDGKGGEKGEKLASRKWERRTCCKFPKWQFTGLDVARKLEQHFWYSHARVLSAQRLVPERYLPGAFLLNWTFITVKQQKVAKVAKSREGRRQNRLENGTWAPGVAVPHWADPECLLWTRAGLRGQDRWGRVLGADGLVRRDRPAAQVRPLLADGWPVHSWQLFVHSFPLDGRLPP